MNADAFYKIYNIIFNKIYNIIYNIFYILLIFADSSAEICRHIWQAGEEKWHLKSLPYTPPVWPVLDINALGILPARLSTYIFTYIISCSDPYIYCIYIVINSSPSAFDARWSHCLLNSTHPGYHFFTPSIGRFGGFIIFLMMWWVIAEAWGHSVSFTPWAHFLLIVYCLMVYDIYIQLHVLFNMIQILLLSF